MDVNVTYNIIKYCANKAQQGYIKPDSFNLIINAAQKMYLDYLLGEYQKYQLQRPISVVELGQTKKLRQSISPLIYGTVFTPSTTGIAPFPSDYQYPDAMWGLYGIYDITFVQQPRLANFKHSQIDPVEQNPIYLINHEGFQFYPENIGMVKLSYVRNPPTIKWAFIEINNREVYDPLNSINPVWSDFDMMNIISRALQMVGINLQSGVVSQYANELKTTGQ